jgi:F-type H+-transporting ATPase subunit a
MSFDVISNLQSLSRRFTRQCLILISALTLLGGWNPSLFAQEAATQPVAVEAPQGVTHEAAATHEGGHEKGGHEGLPVAAPEVPFLQFGPLGVTNSMVLTWVVAILIIIFARYATARMKEIPDGAQNFWEWMVESLRDFLESIIGERLARRTFWFFASVFIFILFTNWFGLVPGIGTIGWGVPNEQGGLTHIEQPLLRGVSADLNMTLAMSLIFFVLWCYWAITSQGFGGFILHLFGNPARKEMSGFLALAMALIFVVVGVLEVVSILFRPVSLSFRLYGNIFAGENLLEAMSSIFPPLAAIIPIPFYFMEVLVGFVQALVFMLLTAVFTVLICSHDDEPGHEH